MAFYNNYRTQFYTNLFKLSHPEEMAIRASVRMDNSAVNASLYRKISESDNFEEETYLDMFIFQEGKKNNKEIYGLEDLAESRDLTTKSAYNVDKKDIDPWLQKLFAKENPYLIQENLNSDRNLDQQQFAKSKLLSNASFEKEKDSISFLLKRSFVTDKGKNAVMYFFKIDKNDAILVKLNCSIISLLLNLKILSN